MGRKMAIRDWAVTCIQQCTKCNSVRVSKSGFFPITVWAVSLFSVLKANIDMLWLKPQMATIWTSISFCCWVTHSHATLENRYDQGGTSEISAVNKNDMFMSVQTSSKVKSITCLFSVSVIWTVKHIICWDNPEFSGCAVDSQENICSRSSWRQPELSTVAGWRSCSPAAAPTCQAAAPTQSSSVTWEDTQRKFGIYWKMSLRSIHWGHQAWGWRYSVVSYLEDTQTVCPKNIWTYTYF